MTTIYFIRHAEADRAVRDGRIRPLTEKGLRDRSLVTEYLQDKEIDRAISSPFKRAVDTISVFAGKNNLDIEIIEAFRERKSDSDWNRENDNMPFLERQWANRTYTLSDGECLLEVQERNINALKDILERYRGENIVIGTHGVSLSQILCYYDSMYDFEDFKEMLDIMPWVAKMTFDENGCTGMEKIDLFHRGQEADYEKCKVRTFRLGELMSYRFVVIFARYQDKWLYCRAKKRDDFETPGGHIGDGETPLEAAKRELYEETGAVAYDMEPVFDYAVHIPEEYANGQMFFARIEELGEIPDFEMSEVQLFDQIPDKMRFPGILPVLYERMQEWLILQFSKDELWDVYDSERNPKGRLHRRADPLPQGDYHLVVHVWLQNSDGRFVITKRAPNKGYPNMWECTGGSAITGDDSIAAAIREVKEETGLDIKPERGKCVLTTVRENSISDIWLFRQEFLIEDVILQENETVDAKYAAAEEIRRMIKNGEFMDFEYIEDLFEMIDNHEIHIDGGQSCTR